MKNLKKILGVMVLTLIFCKRSYAIDGIEFTDGTREMVATPTIAADGTVDWLISEKPTE